MINDYQRITQERQIERLQLEMIADERLPMSEIKYIMLGSFIRGNKITVSHKQQSATSSWLNTPKNAIDYIKYGLICMIPWLERFIKVRYIGVPITETHYHENTYYNVEPIPIEERNRWCSDQMFRWLSIEPKADD